MRRAWPGHKGQPAICPGRVLQSHSQPSGRPLRTHTRDLSYPGRMEGRPRRGAQSKKEEVTMAISARRRASLPRGSYVYGPKSAVGGKGRKSYPIDTPARARNALSRAAQKKTGGSYAKVERAVVRRYPQIATRHSPAGSSTVSSRRGGGRGGGRRLAGARRR